MANLGKYRIVAPLALTDFSNIYVGQDNDLGVPVAIKVLKPKKEYTDEKFQLWRDRFLEEARFLARTDHPHIVRVFDLGEDEDGSPFMVMPFLKANLVREIGHDRLDANPNRRGPKKRSPRALPVQRAVKVWRQVLLALAEIHDQGVVHRDVKPGNILLTERTGGLVKLSDFGMANFGATSFLDKRGAIGTLHYCSPEQAEDPGKVDPRADVYSAGVLMHRMLAGALPEGDGVACPAQGSTAISALNDLVRSCRAARPGDRPPHAGDVVRQLSAIERHHPGPSRKS